MSNIYNYYKVSETLACSGQPREGQLATLAAEGYRVVINLGLLDTKYSLKDEATSVKELGMEYIHIPVQFDNPQIDELALFIKSMSDHPNERVFVHCAANYRASCFTGLHLLSKGEMDEEEMMAFIEEVWQPDNIWEMFLEEGVAFINTII